MSAPIELSPAVEAVSSAGVNPQTLRRWFAGAARHVRVNLAALGDSADEELAGIVAAALALDVEVRP